jgi:tetratricopeptide (TPR) repeat protein
MLGAHDALSPQRPGRRRSGAVMVLPRASQAHPRQVFQPGQSAATVEMFGAMTVRGTCMHPLEHSRTARGWNPPRFARELCALGQTRGVALGSGRDAVYRWEDGRTPDEVTRRLIAELLGIPADAAARLPWPDWLSLDPLLQPTAYPWTASGAVHALAELAGDEVTLNLDRRRFVLLTGTALTTSLWQWMTADPAAAGQLTHARHLGERAVAHVEERVRQLRHADDVDGGGTLDIEAAAALHLVTRTLKDRSYNKDHGRRIHAAATDLARLQAWARFDVREECDDAGFHTALRAAHAADDPALGAHVLTFWAIAASNTGRPRDAEHMLDAALAATRGRTTPRVQAMLYSRRARAHAHQGNKDSYRDLELATELLPAGPVTGEDPEWSAWFDQAELIGVEASTHLDMDRPAQAEKAFARAARFFPPDRIRTQALFLARRADAQYRQGEIEGACATAHEALDLAETTSSHRCVRPLQTLSQRMLVTHPTAVAHDVHDRVTAALPGSN